GSRAGWSAIPAHADRGSRGGATRAAPVNGWHRTGTVATIRVPFPDADAFMTENATATARRIARTIADEIGAQPHQVEAAVALLDEGATVPFIARYRKEATGGLDDTQLRTLETRLAYLRELEERRDRKSTRLNSSHVKISYAVFCLK